MVLIWFQGVSPFSVALKCCVLMMHIINTFRIGINKSMKLLFLIHDLFIMKTNTYSILVLITHQRRLLSLCFCTERYSCISVLIEKNAPFFSLLMYVDSIFDLNTHSETLIALRFFILKASM